MWELGDRIVRRAGVLPGEDVLDLAFGSSEVAIRAAQAGARVVAMELTEGLFDRERRAVARARLELRWMSGRIEALPFDDGAFDVVLSAFGTTFAACDDAVAGEIVRVLRPGGRLVMFNWCRSGIVGRLFDEPWLWWGDEDRVRRAFGATGVELSLEHEIACRPLRSAAVIESVDSHMSVLLALIAVRQLAERRGRWSVVRAELDGLQGAEGESADGHYMVVLGRKRTPVDRSGAGPV
jgi:SAM-dependent methyltransferase